MEDEQFMREALREAARGIGRTSPNPAVGAVIVRDQRILARAHHRRAGEPHAEIEAIRAMNRPEQTRGATLYVTLEPCSTRGRTPPCVEAIIAAGFTRVVIGAIDPNPRHAGRAIDFLRDAGLEVVEGVLRDECEAVNRAFNRWIVTGRPWVIAKAALSLDGRLTRPPGESQWLTNKAARAEAMRLRARVDAILIGAATLRADNPRLTIRGVRGFEGKQPWRVVLTRSSRLPQDAHLLSDEHRDRTLIFKNRSLRAVLTELGRREITSVLIEGGGEVLGDAFDRGLVDEVHFFLAPRTCGGPHVIGGRGAGATAESIGIVAPRYERLGDDLHVSGLTSAGATPHLATG